MRRSVWKWIGLGAAVMLLLIYFMELTAHGLQRMNEPSYAKATKTNVEQVDNELMFSLGEEENNLSRTQNDIYANSGLEQELAKLESDMLRLKKKALEQEKIQLEQLLLNEEQSDSKVNKLADTTSGALQSLSSSGLQFVAEMFHKIIN